MYINFLHLHISGVVTAEMFRHMQNSEIIRKMTEEFDEVTYPKCFDNFMHVDLDLPLKVFLNSEC